MEDALAKTGFLHKLVFDGARHLSRDRISQHTPGIGCPGRVLEYCRRMNLSLEDVTSGEVVQRLRGYMLCLSGRMGVEEMMEWCGCGAFQSNKTMACLQRKNDR